jgi:ABC-type transport system involved in cytochrome c biogenesis ATPase subunit
MEERLRADGLVKRFEAGFGACRAAAEVLRGVSLVVRAGEVLAVQGARGAGKTTLLRCLAGLLRPDGGGISWLGQPAGGDRPPGIALAADHGIGYAFLGVRESLEFHALAHDLPIGDRGARVREVIRRVGLAHAGDVRVALLDAMDLLRLRLAEALLGDPRLLLVDAPHYPLDPSQAAALARLLGDIAARGAAIIVAARRAEPLGGATRHVVLRWGVLEEPWAPEPRAAVLELDVDDAERALRVLATLGATPRGRSRTVRVPLDVAGAEAVLAECLRHGVRVLGSRVVASALPEPDPGATRALARVAERRES